MVTVQLKETKEAFVFVIALVKAIDISINDGDEKLGLEDVPNFFPAFFKLMPAIEGADRIPMELKAVDPAEAQNFKEWLKVELDLKDDKIEEAIEDGFAIILDIYMFWKKYVAKEEPLPIDNGGEVPGDTTVETEKSAPEQEG